MAALGDVGVDPVLSVGGAPVSGFRLPDAGSTISGTATISGTPGRTAVALRALRGGIEQYQESGDDGIFAFHNLSPGSYEVVVFGGGTYRSKVFGPITVP